MEPAVGMALLWFVFVGTHIGLTTRAIRARLVGLLGDWGFNLSFSAVAMVSFAIAVHYYAEHRFEGVAGLGLVDLPILRGVLIGVIVIGVVLATGSFATYSRSPYAVLSNRPTDGPRGLERITRHPFMVGVVLLALAHAFLARWMVGTVFALGLAFLGSVGAYHQDRKLLARKGAPYAAYLRATSAIPFAAIAAGRQRLVWRELPFAALGLGLVLAVGLRAVHDSMFAHGGAWVVGVVGASVALITLETWRRVRRSGSVSSQKSAATAFFTAEAAETSQRRRGSGQAG